MSIYDDDGPGPHAPALYIGGYFGAEHTGFPRPLPGVTQVAKWNGSAWSPLGTGVDDDVNINVLAMCVFDDDGDGPLLPALYVSGEFFYAGGIPTGNIARWDGTHWSVVGEITYGLTASLVVFDDDGDGPHREALYASPFITYTGEGLIGKWDGTSWTSIGGPYESIICPFDEDGDGPEPARLYAAPGFWGDTQIAVWNGSQWTSLGSGPTHGVFCMEEYDADGPGGDPPELIIGGDLSPPILRWSRKSGWITQGIPTGVGYWAWSMTRFDEDGDGPLRPVLYVGGYFGDTSILRWDGYSWDKAIPLVGGGDFASPPTVLAMTPFDPDGEGPRPATLYLGGTVALNVTSPYSEILNWGFQGASGDLNGDGATNGKDIGPFIDGVFANLSDPEGRCAGDFTLDGVVDANDIPGFVAKLAKR